MQCPTSPTALTANAERAEIPIQLPQAQLAATGRLITRKNSDSDLK